jgi:hypothetical protein
MFGEFLSSRQRAFVPLLLIGLVFCPIFAHPQSKGSLPRAFPVVFEPNRGQAPEAARYIARTREGLVTVGSDKLDIVQRGAEGGQGFELRFDGAHPRQFREEDQRDGGANYYYGGASLRRLEHVPMFRRIRYAQIYAGIDLVLHGTDGRLEYDFELAPNTSPASLRISLPDSEKGSLEEDGSLLITAGGHGMRLLAPHAFQPGGSQPAAVEVAYQVLGPHEIGFKLGTYDADKPLTIDPVVSYAEMVTAAVEVDSVAVDTDGSLVIAGVSNNSHYPVIDGLPPVPNANSDVYVTRFDPTGETIVYSTFLPAQFFSRQTALALDKAGNTFVAGIVSDPAFAVTSHALGACNTFCNAGFVAKFDPTGALLYSTLLGSGQILPKALAVDASGNALVSGLAADGSMQTVNAYQAEYTGGLCTSCWGAFFAKLNATGTGFIFSSYLGSGDIASGLALDSAGNVYVAGTADNVYGATIPLKGEFESGVGDYFLTKFSPDGKTLLFGTFFGGYPNLQSPESLAGMRVGADGTVYLGGTTWAVGFPYTVDAYRLPTTAISTPRMFALAFDPSLAKLKYSTDLGGGYMNAMTVDAAGNFYAAAQTGVDPVQPKNAVVSDVTAGGFFLELDSSGKPVQTSAFGGQIVGQVPTGIAVDPAESIYIAGVIGGGNNPFMTGCEQGDPILVGSNTYGIQAPNPLYCAQFTGIFLSKIAPDVKPQISLSQFLPFLYLHNVGTADLHISSITFSGGLASAAGTCGKTVPAGTSCILTLSDGNGKFAQGSVTINSDADPPSQTFTPYLDSRAVGGAVPDYLYVDISQLHFQPQFAGTTSPAQPVNVWNAGLKNLALNSIVATPYLTQTNNCPATLAPGAHCTVQVSWDTTSTYQSDAIGIAYDGNPEVDLNLFGTYQVSPTALMLSQAGPIPLSNETQGHPYFYRTLTVTNVSNAAVNVPQVAANGDSVFSITGNTCSGSLAPHQSCVVAFAMDSNGTPGQHIGTLDFSGSLSASVQVWGVIILPQAILPSTYQMTWTPLLLGKSLGQDLTLTNSSSAAASISGFSFITSDYSETDNCVGSPLPPGGSCTVHVVFTPQGLGQRSDSMSINLGTSMNPVAISLTGQGQYSLAISPQVVDFGNENLVSTTSAAKTVTVTNETAASVGYTLASTGPFNITNQCANPVPAQKPCTISITYSPTVVEYDAGSLTVTANGSATTNSVSLFGTSTQGSIMSVPSDFKFPDTQVGKTATASIRISNTGRLALSNVNFSLSGNEAADFTFTPSQCSTIPVGGNCTVALSFSPSAEGGRYASIAITSDASNSPRIVTLTGTGTNGQAKATLSMTSLLDFGKQDEGTRSAASQVTLTNSGSVALAITSSVSSADFPQTNTCGSTVAAGASCAISIVFAPSKVGAETGTLTVSDSAGVQTLSLLGMGTAPTVALGPASGGR